MADSRDLHERASKINPVFADGPLVKVAGGRNQAEAELVQGLLLEEGVPSMVRRSRGFDVPDMLAAGPRDVMVPRSGLETARAVLRQAELLGSDDADGDQGGAGAGLDPPARVLAGLVAALVLVAIIAWIGTELLV